MTCAAGGSSITTHGLQHGCIQHAILDCVTRVVRATYCTSMRQFCHRSWRHGSRSVRRHTSRFDKTTCHPPPRSRNCLGRRTSRRHIVVTSAKEASVITPENALVDVLATVTLNTVVSERAVVAARLVRSVNDNRRATRIAIAGMVCRLILSCKRSHHSNRISLPLPVSAHLLWTEHLVARTFFSVLSCPACLSTF